MNEFHCYQRQPLPKQKTLHLADYNFLQHLVLQSKKDNLQPVIYK